MELVADAGNSTTTIPVDLIIEILSLLPAKSIIRFQSVSKQWFSIIRSKDLVGTFLTRSKSQSHLLFVLEPLSPKKRFIFSVLEHNSNDKTSTAIARYDMTHSTGIHYYFCSRPVNGFVCFTGIDFSTGVCHSITVCNPITGQTVQLPQFRNNVRNLCNLLGYDPVEDQYKVLCVMMYERYRDDQRENQLENYVCTVSSSQKQEWRKIENTTTVDNFRHVFQGICIDGAIYYRVEELSIVRFDVRSEKMEKIKAPEESNIWTTSYSTLVNYNGRLGGVVFHYYQEEIRLWILEDVEKQEWSRNTFKYPTEWKVFRFDLDSVGVIHTGELMVFRRSLKEANQFYVYDYDFSKESSRKVEIQVMETDQRHGKMLCYPDYCENIRFL